MTEAKWALDRSQLDRQLLGDVAALLAVKVYLDEADPGSARRARVIAEIEDLMRVLWPPTG